MLNNQTHTDMTTLTITVPGTKAGELVYFTLKMAKANFLAVVDMVENFNSTEDVIKNQGLYELV